MTGRSTSEAGGRFAGVGPKNFNRSKERVIEDVNQSLTDRSEIDATEIDVDYENGEVILRGRVETRQQKKMAEEIAEQVQGARDVRNELRVGSGKGADSDSKEGSASAKGKSGTHAEAHK